MPTGSLSTFSVVLNKVLKPEIRTQASKNLC